MAFYSCHEHACHPYFGMLDGKQRGGNAQQRIDQRAQGEQAKHIRFCRKAVNVSPILPSNAVQPQTNITAARMRMAVAWKGEKSPNIPCFESTSPTYCLAQPCQLTEKVHAEIILFC
jgi:hypothetical protein